MRKRVLGIALCLVAVAATLLCNAFTNKSSAASINDHIDEVLSSMDVTDAVCQGEVSHELDTWVKYILYTSESTGMEYYFSPSNGTLIKIVQMNYNDSAQNVPDQIGVLAVTVPTDEEMRVKAVEYAEMCIAQNRIGELRIVRERINSMGWNYTIAEFYEDIPTGTEVYLDYDEKGELYACAPTIGKLFAKDVAGGYKMLRPDYISQQDAVDAAYANLTENQAGITSVDTDKATCTMEAYEDVLTYWVRMPIVTAEGESKVFMTEIDAYTAEALDAGFIE